MKRVLYAYVCTVLLLAGCSSGKSTFERGNYYQAVLTSVNRLRRNSDHKKSVETLRQAYPMAVAFYEDRAKTSLASNEPFKWSAVVDSYTMINNMYDEIKRCPGALAVIPNPLNYFDKLQEAKANAAEEHYAAGILALEEGSREKAKIAYNHFKTADSFVPGYKEVNSYLQAALDAATVKVVVEQIPVHSKAVGVSAEFFNDKISEYVHGAAINEFVKFYTREEATNIKLNPDHIIQLSFDDFTVGQVVTNEKEIHLTKDSVVMATYVTPENTAQSASPASRQLPATGTPLVATTQQRVTTPQNTQAEADARSTQALAEKEAAQKALAAQQLAEKQRAEREAAERALAEKRKAEQEGAAKALAAQQRAEKEQAEKQAAAQALAEKQKAEKEAAEKAAAADKEKADKEAAQRALEAQQLAEKQKAEKEAAQKALEEKQRAEKEAAAKALEAQKLAEKQRAEKEAAEKALEEKRKAEQEAAEKAAAEKAKAEPEKAEKSQGNKAVAGVDDSIKKEDTTNIKDPVTICHIPPGNKGNRHTLVINRSALPAHLRHGDVLGSCEPADNGNSGKDKKEQEMKKAPGDKKNSPANKPDKGAGKNGTGQLERATDKHALLFDDAPVFFAALTNKPGDYLRYLDVGVGDTNKVYGTVKATLFQYKKTTTSKGVVSFRIVDARTGALLASEKMPGEFVWVSEWATFNGDERALSPEQLELTKLKEQPAPSPQELFIEFTKPIYEQITAKIHDFYRNY